MEKRRKQDERVQEKRTRERKIRGGERMTGKRTRETRIKGKEREREIVRDSMKEIER